MKLQVRKKSKQQQQQQKKSLHAFCPTPHALMGEVCTSVAGGHILSWNAGHLLIIQQCAEYLCVRATLRVCVSIKKERRRS